MNDIQRAIEELRYQEDMRGKGIPYQVDSLVIATAISAMQELKQYRQIGTLEECREAREKIKVAEKSNVKTAIVDDVAGCRIVEIREAKGSAE